MFYFNSQNNQARLWENKRIEDSIVASKPKKVIDTVAMKLDNAKKDSILKAQKQLPSTFIADTTEQLAQLENDVFKITFTNKGGQPKLVELKKFKTFDGRPLFVQAGNFNKLNYPIIYLLDYPASLIISKTG